MTDSRNLRYAWDKVARNKGHRTPGIDGQTVGSIRRTIGEAAYLESLRQGLRDGSYRPHRAAEN